MLNDEKIEDPSIRVVSRCIAILQALNRGSSLNLAEIAANARIPYPTAYRIVRALIHEGMIEQEPSRKYYRPTALVQSLSHGYQDYSQLVVISRPHLVALTAQTNWPAIVATPVGHKMVVRDGTHSLTPMTFNPYYPGFVYTMLDSPTGRVCLAFCEDEERRLCLEGMIASGEPLDPATFNGFRSGSLVEQIRARGYASIARNRFTQPMGKNSSIAVPIFSKGRLVAAASLILFASAMSMDEAEKLYVPSLISMAKAISEKLSATDVENKESAP